MLSANCRRVLALRSQHTRTMIAFLATDLAHVAYPTVANLRDLAQLNQAGSQLQAQIQAASAALSEGERNALHAHLNPADEADEARRVGALLVPVGTEVH